MTLDEWKILTEHFTPDRTITVIKSSLSEVECKNGETESFSFIFEPSTCEVCLEKNELDKYLFENKKIFIRIIDDETPAAAAATTKNDSPPPKQSDEALKETNEKDDDISEIVEIKLK